MAKVTGHLKHLRRLAAMENGAERAMGAVLFAGAEMIRADAAKSITNGAIQGKNHIPSLPFEPPNADTRTLDTSIVSRVLAQLHTEVRVGAPYGAALEFGADYTDGRKLIERPFMRPATARNKDKIMGMAREAVKILVRRR